ncbi:MAG: autotransporter-associated beta strand repeat-containing protein [Verrucomicrobiales bacterium]|jgi:autotransporter-associated beta strand protein|nr:autotransporter-associated beta strand repeat-containing protein [Verrucomicrobiales bacterium]
MKTGKHGLLQLALTITLSLSAALLAPAADRTWSGADGDRKFSTAANWDAPPVNGDSLFFNASLTATLDNDLASLSVANLTFNVGAAALTIGGNPLTLTGAITNNSAAVQTLDTDIVLGNNLWFSGSGATVVSGNISGNYSVDVTHAARGTVTLSGSNSYTGDNYFGADFNVRLDYSDADATKLGQGKLDLTRGVLTLVGGTTQEQITYLGLGNVGGNIGGAGNDYSGGRGYNAIRREGGSASIYVTGTAIGRALNSVLDIGGDNLLGGTAEAFGAGHGGMVAVWGNDAAWITINGRDWATRDADTGLLQTYQAYTLSAPDTWTDADNARLSADTTVSGAKNINTLKIDGGTALTLDNQLKLNAGGLIYSGENAYTISGGSMQGPVDDLLIWQNGGDLTIASSIVNNYYNGNISTRLVKSGTGALILTGSNSFLGGVAVWQGDLVVGGSHALGTDNGVSLFAIGSGARVELNGYDVTGVLSYNDVNQGLITNSAAGLSTLTVTGNVGTLSFLQFDGKVKIVLSGLASGQSWGFGIVGAPVNTHTGGVTFLNNDTSSRFQGTRFFGSGTITFANGGFNSTDNADNSWNNWSNDLLITGTAGGQDNLIATSHGITSTGTWFGDGKLTVSNYGNANVTFAANGDMSQFTGTLTLVETVSLSTKFLAVNLGTTDGSRDWSQAAIVLSSNVADTAGLNGTGYLNHSGGSTVVKIGDLSGGDDVLTASGATGKWLVGNTGNSIATYEVGALGLNSTFSGHLVNENGTLALTKVGAGTWTLDNSNTYRGATTVSGGVLLVGGTGSLTATSVITATAGGVFRYDSNQLLDRAVTVSGGRFAYNGSEDYAGTLTFTNGALGGTNWRGSLDNLTIGSDQTIAPGNSIGAAVTGTQTWYDDGVYEFEIGDAAGGAGTGWDLLTADTLTLDIYFAYDAQFTIKLLDYNLTGFDATRDYQWDFAHFTTLDVSELAGGAFNPLMFAVDASGFLGGAYADSLFDVSLGDHTLLLNYTAIPEPATWALLLIGAALTVLGCRRNSRVKIKPGKLLVALTVSVAWAATAPAQVLYNVAFPSSAGDVSGAAATGADGDVWNNLPAAGWYDLHEVTGTTLADAAGAGHGVTLTTNKYVTKNTPAVNLTPNPLLSDGNVYLQGSPSRGQDAPLTFSISGLAANASLDLWLYCVIDASRHNVEVTVSDTKYLLQGPNGQDEYDTLDVANTFVSEAQTVVGGYALTYKGNYIHLSGFFTDALGYFSFDVGVGANSMNGEAGITGFQLLVTPIPEPSALALTVTGLVLLAVLRRKKVC